MKNHFSLLSRKRMLFALICAVGSVFLFSGTAWAVWCATSECSGCGSHSWSKREECRFESQTACSSEIARIKREMQVAAAVFTCYEKGSGSSSSSSGSDILTNPLGNMVQGMMSGNLQQMQMAGGVMGLSMMLQGLQGDPAADARRAQEAEQQRQAAEQRKADELQQQELAKQRILGLLKGSESSTKLALKTDDTDTTLTVSETQGAFGSTEVKPTSIDSPPAEHGLQLKLGDDADRSSMQARQGFDTAGKIMGSDLPPPPRTPTSKSTANKSQLLNALKSKLKKNEAEEQALKDQLAQLQKAPTPDPVAISQVQEKIVVKEKEKKKIMLDLTADDPDAQGSNQSSRNTNATSTGAVTKGASH